MKFLKEFIYRLRGEYTTEKLISMGMKVGKNFGRLNGVILDPSHCWLIEIGDNVTMAPRVHVLAHDASTKQFLGYTKIGRVSIGNNVFIGAESVVLPGVTIGNNVIVGANSTVTKDIPDNTVVVGTPARVLCTLDEYLEKEKNRMSKSKVYGEEYTLRKNVSMELSMKQKEDLEKSSGGGVHYLMKKECISIIIPAYNIGQYIRQCIESVLNQTYSNIEIIIVDDGSKDNTKEIIDEYALKDKRIIAIHKENGGVSSARLRGIQEANGEWIGFVDGDDYIEPNMFETLYKNAIKHNADISHCGYQMVFPNRIDRYYGTGKIIEQDHLAGLKDLLEGTMIEPGLVNKLYKKDLLKDIHNKLDLSIKINEDLLMNYYLFKESNNSIYEDKCLYHYQVRANSAALSKLNVNKLLDPIKVTKKLLEETKEIEELNRIVRSRYVYQLIYLAIQDIKENRDLVYIPRKEARKELSCNLFSILKDNAISKKNKIMALWVAIWPYSYKLVHDLYLKKTGLDKKFSVD